MEIELLSKDGYTYWVEIRFAESEYPSQLIADFEKAGWNDGTNGGLFGKIPPLNGICTETYCKGGEGLFSGWSLEERKVFLPEARKILKKHGYTNIPKRTLTLQELM